MRQKSNTVLTKSLSVVVPVYKQEKTIYRNIMAIRKALDILSSDYEIIVVVDGIQDKSYENAKKARSKKIKVIAYKENQGKGYAVKLGVMKAKGEIVGFIDGGMDIKTNGISILLDHFIFHDADVVVGSKLHPDSEVNYPIQRRILSFGYRFLTRLLFNLQVKDTQVGLKLFRRDVARDIFSRNLVKRFAFDVEVLALANALGYTKIYEAPIKLYFRKEVSSITTANFWRVSWYMLLDTLGIFYRLRIIQYYKITNNEHSDS